MTDLRLAIWDVDGTIVDSRETIHNVMVEAFRQSGLVPPEYDDTRRIVGLSLHEACAQLAPGASADDIERLVTDYRNTWVRARARPDFQQPLYEGALETLEALRDEGWLIGMATGKTRAGIASLFKLHQLEHFFDTIWCADDGPGKPHPHMVEQAMGALGVAPGAAVHFSETVSGFGCLIVVAAQALNALPERLFSGALGFIHFTDTQICIGNLIEAGEIIFPLFSRFVKKSCRLQLHDGPFDIAVQQLRGCPVLVLRRNRRHGRLTPKGRASGKKKCKSKV